MNKLCCIVFFAGVLGLEAVGLKRLAEHQGGATHPQHESQWLPNTDASLLDVFGALHDPKSGEIQTQLELYPIDACDAIETCAFPGTALADVAAVVLKPYGKQRDQGEPEAQECMIRCQLLAGEEDTELTTVILQDKYKADLLTLPAERLLVLTKKKGVGICLAPVFTDTPHYLDWLAYHDMIGVEGIHLYVVEESHKIPEVWGRGTADRSKQRIIMQNHHLVTWHVHKPANFDVPSVYYSQKTLINDCVFRHRHVYDFIAIIDRDEFIHVEGSDPRRVNVAAILHEELDGTRFASAAMMAAMYPVRCRRKQAQVVGQLSSESTVEVHGRYSDYWEYEGYSVWQPDPRMPDFFNCSVDPYGVVFKPLGRNCHTKSFVRPLAVSTMSAHSVAWAREGYEWVPKPLPPSRMYNKHLQCIVGEKGWEEEGPLCLREGPVDYAQTAGHGVMVCPQDTSSTKVWNQTEDPRDPEAIPAGRR